MAESNGFTFSVAPNCTKCSACSHVCPSKIIVMTADGPSLPNARICIKCGHCVAVCPVDALDFSLTPRSRQKKIDRNLTVSAEQAEQFLRTRRSVRNFRNLPVDSGKIEKLLDVAHFAPSGGNTQNVAYIVVKEEESIKQLSSLTLDWMDEQSKVSVSFRQYASLVKAGRDSGYDIIFRGAPAVIIAVGLRKMPITRDNARFCLAYAELFAPTLKLGTCWAGFFEMSAGEYRKELYDILGLNEEQMVVGAIMVGSPKYHFKTMVDRNDLQVTWI